MGAAPPLTRLAARGIGCVRGGRTLFQALDLVVGPGGAVMVEGPNGAGKSSLLRVLAGLLDPDSGKIERPQRTAYLGHENALKPQRRLGDELRHWARLDAASPALATAAIERFALGPLLPMPVSMLSNGQKRRGALARVAASGAALWLLDEPEVGLDARAIAALTAAIADHRGDGGMVVAVSHGGLRLDDAPTLALG